jgi:hypothetical protein
VEELKTWLGLLDRLHHPKTLDYRRHVLFAIMASTAVLARRCIDDDVADQLLIRERDCLRTAPAWKGRTKKSREIAGVVYKYGRQVRLAYPTKKRGTVAKEILDPVNAELKAGGRKKRIVQKTVELHLKANWGRLRDLNPLTKAQLKLPERLFSRSS